MITTVGIPRKSYTAACGELSDTKDEAIYCPAAAQDTGQLRISGLNRAHGGAPRVNGLF